VPSKDVPPEGGLDRAAAILGAFDAAHRELTLAALVARSGLPRSTTHRTADRMIRLGWLEKPGDRYRIGNRLFEVASLAPIRLELREAVLPFLQDLHQATKITVQLGVLDGTQVLVVEKITGHRAMPMLSQTGGMIPAYCSALGRAILAYSEPAVIDAVLAGPLPAPTPRTPGGHHAGADGGARARLGDRPGGGQHRRQLRRRAHLRAPRRRRGGGIGHRPQPAGAGRPRRAGGADGGRRRVPRLHKPPTAAVPMSGTHRCGAGRPAARCDITHMRTCGVRP
jgi:hypothetical protein